jgi:hypothetical protein
MKLNPYVAGVRAELLTVAEAGGEAALELAERLTSPLEAAIRLTLLQALSAAAEEITAELAPGSVEVRLRGADPEFVVAVPPSAAPGPAEAAEPESASVAQVQLPSAPEDDDGTMVRINLRLPAHLKSRVEEAADALGFSVNNWLVRAAAAALENERRPRQPRTNVTGQSLSGWAR